MFSRGQLILFSCDSGVVAMEQRVINRYYRDAHFNFILRVYIGLRVCMYIFATYHPATHITFSPVPSGHLVPGSLALLAMLSNTYISFGLFSRLRQLWSL